MNSTIMLLKSLALSYVLSTPYYVSRFGKEPAGFISTGMIEGCSYLTSMALRLSKPKHQKQEPSNQPSTPCQERMDGWTPVTLDGWIKPVIYGPWPWVGKRVASKAEVIFFFGGAGGGEMFIRR
jgi:hypothetical protein